ncbi:low specificity L-threonine aldolase [Microlunatus sp. Gsoil 973]|jgi:threonine aldolase|uniref:threonine aldolase family protein n=1 Tax=Microlunatus sp. Gsoil 973 TaxID=2672569 RepID=UPI0012B4EB56|nr:low specificity L-threonine aldolase [Microlunatus sp. Gsoil 973]QGN35405.1 threonine aldolase [Microlunatus sp. Gsoil 973]
MTTLHDPGLRGFASDNYAGVHPEVLQAVAAANGGHQVSYGADAYTARLQEVLVDHFGPRVQGFGVFNGTGANVVGLQAMLPHWGAVICAESAHINTDENGAPERVAGIKLLTVPTPDGKLRPADLDRFPRVPADVHHPLPEVVSITESTELGTAYTAEEIEAVASRAHRLGLAVHMDGSRLANAAAGLGVPLRALTTDVGVDVVSLGGTKNGLMFGELVLAINPDAVTGLAYLQKLNMQLASKMRFLSAQFIALLDGDLWRRSAGRANAMAKRLRTSLEGKINSGVIDGIGFTQPTDANSIFATLPEGVADRLRQKFAFYDWNPAVREVRWVCSFDTTQDDVDDFAMAIEAELAGPA